MHLSASLRVGAAARIEAQSPPSAHVIELGLSITTGRCIHRLTQWTATTVAQQILRSFPKLAAIGVNLEVGYDAQSQLDMILGLFHMLAAAKIHITTHDVFLVSLPSSARLIKLRLGVLTAQLQGAGVAAMFKAPRARTTREYPCDGFRIPASLFMSAPTIVCDAVSDSLWQVVW